VGESNRSTGQVCVLLVLALLVGCRDSGGSRFDAAFDSGPGDTGLVTPTLTIVLPETGSTVQYDHDDGFRYGVVVWAAGLSVGDGVALSNDQGNSVSLRFEDDQMLTFEDFVLGTEPGEVTLIAVSGETQSDPVTITLEGEAITCPSVEITSPLNGAVLSSEDDEDMGTPGLQYTVVASTDAGDGSELLLYLDGSDTGEATTARGLSGTFANIDLPEGGGTVIEVRVADVDEACTDWSQIDVTVDTTEPPCLITDPGSSVYVLNIAEDDDTAPGMQVDVAVGTEVDDTVTVTLLVDGVTHGVERSEIGTVEFLAVALDEGTRSVTAQCQDIAGNLGLSMSYDFLVDTIPPDITILPVVADDALPLLDGIQFEVCGTTTARDTEGQDLCAWVVGSLPSDVFGCGPVAAGAACVYVEALPATTDVEAMLSDAAGNTASSTATVGS